MSVSSIRIYRYVDVLVLLELTSARQHPILELHLEHLGVASVSFS